MVIGLAIGGYFIFQSGLLIAIILAVADFIDLFLFYYYCKYWSRRNTGCS